MLKEASRDYFLTKQNLGNINHSIGEHTWMEDALPNQSIRMHQPEHQSWYLCYEKQDVKAQKPFIVASRLNGNARNWHNLAMVVQCVLMTTLGQNGHKFPLTTFAVYDTHKLHLIPAPEECQRTSTWARNLARSTDVTSSPAHCHHQPLCSRLPRKRHRQRPARCGSATGTS